MGNICRSPMSERLLTQAVHARVGDRADVLIISESAGTGSWHAGQPMNDPAARELGRRGASSAAFQARTLLASHIDTADLVLTATSEQLDFVDGLRPDASSRSFVLGEFGRLARDIVGDDLPAFVDDPDSVHKRGVALVAAVDAARRGARPRAVDDLDDPYGQGDAFFRSTADQIADSIEPLVELLIPTADNDRADTGAEKPV
jgi:protein-tyrosine phosphatase